MDQLFKQIQIQVNSGIYVKDPHSSVLGKNIIKNSIAQIDQLGMEGFTFGKLAKQLNTAESSIYRYFENKNKLLIYLTSWYWGWLEYQLVFATANINSPHERLKESIKVLCSDMTGESSDEGIDLEILNRIIISESSKAYLTKVVDDNNKEGFFAGYKRMVKRVSDIVLEIDPNFSYAHTLISTIVEGIHHQKFFADHLPSLTDLKNNIEHLVSFYTNMALATIEANNK